MPIVILVLAVVIVVASLSRGKKGTVKQSSLSEEERQLRQAPENTIDLLPFLDNPTPAMKAEYVRRRGSWPGYTADDFARDATLAQDFTETVERYASQRNPQRDAQPKACVNTWIEERGAFEGGTIETSEGDERPKNDDLPGFRPAR